MYNKNKMETKEFKSRAYWDKYISDIISSINEDKDMIIDMFMYGRFSSAEITMKISPEALPSYQLKIDKLGKIK